MGKMSVYSETIQVRIMRSGTQKTVMFCDVKDGDRLVDFGGAIVDGDSHFSGDSTYEGWIFFDTSGNDYYPEDFII